MGDGEQRQTSVPTMSSTPHPATHFVLTRGRACAVCRRKKHRCDAAKPVCGPCVKAGVAERCAYDGGPKKTWVQTLQDRVRELEDNIEELQPLVAASPESLPPPPTSNPRRLRITSPPATITLPPVLPRQNPIFRYRHREDLPRQIRDTLIQAFFKHRWQHTFEFDIPRFWAAYILPQSHPDSIHPALLDALCLLGCTYLKHPEEPLYLSRLKQSLTRSLETADRLFDFLRASSLLATYFYRSGRLTEFYYALGSAARFAVACGLHRIHSLDLDAYPASSVLGPPHDMAELGNRINVFWSLFCIDRLASLLNGLPPAFPADNAITTIWPCPLEYYTDGRALLMPYGSASTLHELHPETHIYYENIVSIRAKCIAILHRAVSLASRAQVAPEEITLEVAITEQTLEYLAQPTAALQIQEQSRPPSLVHHENTVIAVALTSMHAAAIQLHGINASRDLVAYQRRLDAARSAMGIILGIGVSKNGALRLLIEMNWAMLYEIFLTELNRLQELGDEEGATAVQVELDILDALRQPAKPGTRLLDRNTRVLGKVQMLEAPLVF